jgi:hypothetical protein
VRAFQVREKALDLFSTDNHRARVFTAVDTVFDPLNFGARPYLADFAVYEHVVRFAPIALALQRAAVFIVNSLGPQERFQQRLRPEVGEPRLSPGLIGRKDIAGPAVDSAV